MGDKTWKSVERRYARMFGAERNQDTHGFDFETPLLRVEVKHRARLPRLLVDACAQIEAAAEGKIPVAIFHEKQQPLGESLAVLRVADLAAILKEEGPDAS